MQTPISLSQLRRRSSSSSSQCCSKTNHQVLAGALVSLALILIYSSSGPTSSRLWAVSVAEASPTQPLTSSSTLSSSSSGGLTSGSGQQQQQQQQQESKGIFKRSFAGLGCLGVYDKAKFARLDRVCEECYTLYREPDIHSACRQDCFRNGVFTRCVDALLLSHEAKKFDEMVDELYGK